MTPEETEMFMQEVEQVISAEEIEEILPLTEGNGSIYRKDETGSVSHEKVVQGAEHARINFRMRMPEIHSPDFKKFISDVTQLAETGSIKTAKTFSADAIESVKTGGIIGSIANEIIKSKHGEK